MKNSGIKTKLNIVGGLFTLILIILVSITIILNNQSKNDALIVNISGFQRMLSQKMSKEIIYIHLQDSNDFRELNQAMDLFEYNLNNLIGGNKNKGIKAPQSNLIKEKLNEVKNKWLPFKDEIISFQYNINKNIDELKTLNAKTEKLIQESDRLHFLMTENKVSANLLQLSQKQTFLTQRMELFLIKYLKTNEKNNFLFFQDTKNTFDKNLKYLLETKELKENQNIYEQIIKTNKFWENYKKSTQILINEGKKINKSVDYIFQNNIKILNTMDEAVSLYTQESENKNDNFMNTIYIVSLIAILIAIYSYILTREVSLHINNFVKQAKILASRDFVNINQDELDIFEAGEEELQEATSHIKNYVQKVNKATKHSKNTVLNAENVANELQKLVLDIKEALDELDVDDKEKTKFNKKVNDVEDMAIESAENLITVSKMLTSLRLNLYQIAKNHK